jgi:hypothetical protein
MLMKNPKTKNQYPAYAAQYSDDGKKNQRSKPCRKILPRCAPGNHFILKNQQAKKLNPAAMRDFSLPTIDYF